MSNRSPSCQSEARSTALWAMISPKLTSARLGVAVLADVAGNQIEQLSRQRHHVTLVEATGTELAVDRPGQRGDGFRVARTRCRGRWCVHDWLAPRIQD